MNQIKRHVIFTVSGIGLTFGLLSLSNTYKSTSSSYQSSYQQRLRDAFKKLKKRDESLIGTFYRDVKYFWNQQSQGQKLAFGIIGINSIIFGLWQIPRLSSFMQRYFVHDPASGRVLTLWTSAYSHQSFLQ